jgi:hypothetical protein
MGLLVTQNVNGMPTGLKVGAAARRLSQRGNASSGHHCIGFGTVMPLSHQHLPAFRIRREARIPSYFLD